MTACFGCFIGAGQLINCFAHLMLDVF